MGTFAVKIWYDEGKMCTFYSVSLDVDDDDGEAEVDKFFDKYLVEGGSYNDEASLILNLLMTPIADVYGATSDFFNRLENHATALPPKITKLTKGIEEVSVFGINFPLRLYCLKISESLVVLFNGGIKNAGTAQESDLSFKFQEAQVFAQKITKALSSGEIELSIDGKFLLSFDGSRNIIL